MKKTTRILSVILLAATASTGASANSSGPDDSQLPTEGHGSRPAAASMVTKASTLATAPVHAATYCLPAEATVGGVTLKSGNTYRVEWTGQGPDVQITVFDGKKSVVELAGTVRTLDKSATGDTVVARPTAAGASGTSVATELRFAGKRVALKLAETPLTAAATRAAK